MSSELLFFCSLAFAAALAAAFVGLRWGTYAAGGSDSSCYALMADAFAAGSLQPTSDLALQVPWPDAEKTFTPGGFVASETNPAASAPVCAPGFSLLLAPLIAVGGRDAIFLFTPIAGALLVWSTFLAGRTLANPLSGVMAAVLIACTPAFLYQVVQPMNDVTTAAMWMATFVALLRRRWVSAGICCGLALLVRPNLLPVAIVAGVFVILDSRFEIRQIARFAVAAAPFGLLVLWLNNGLYGSPFRTGYGQLGHLFSLSALSINASRYLQWLVETQTPFPLLGLAAPFFVAREKRRHAALGLGMALATCVVYLFYTPFEEWTYVRFLLPAIALLLVLASVAAVHAIEYVAFRRVRLKADTTDTSPPAANMSTPAKTWTSLNTTPARPWTSLNTTATDTASATDTTSATNSTSVVSGFSRTVIIVLITAILAILYVRTANDRLAFNLKHLEQRYRSAGTVVRDRLPANAVVLSVWDSGAVRFHGRKEAIAWAGLDPAWLDRSLSWLDAQGRTPYILVESWEEPDFRRRFAAHSDIGKLDWPPKYEIDRVVRIFDPKDRARYDRGEHVSTEYLWPSRD